MDLLYKNSYLIEKLIQMRTRYMKIKSSIPGHQNLLKIKKDKVVFSL